METALAILMVLGIFVGVPALIGFATAGVYILSDRRVRKAKAAKALEAVTEVPGVQPAETPAEEPTREPVEVK